MERVSRLIARRAVRRFRIGVCIAVWLRSFDDRWQGLPIFLSICFLEPATVGCRSVFVALLLVMFEQRLVRRSMGGLLFQSLMQPIQAEMLLTALEKKRTNFKERVGVGKGMIRCFLKQMVDPFQTGQIFSIAISNGFRLFRAPLSLEAVGQ